MVTRTLARLFARNRQTANLRHGSTRSQETLHPARQALSRKISLENLEERFALSTTSTFQEGVDGYMGTADTQLLQANAAAPQGATAGILIDFTDANANNAGHGLLRFDNIFGNGAGQVPLGSRIISARVEFTTFNGGDGGQLYRVLNAWDESTATWDSFTDGLANDGIELNTVSFAHVGNASRNADAPNGVVYPAFVTEDVQAWSDGTANHGWGFIPWASGTDGWEFRTKEHGTVTQRPRLVVEWEPAGTNFITFQNGVGGYQGTQDTWIQQNVPAAFTAGTQTTTIFSDFTEPNANANHQLLIRFDNIFGNGPNQIPYGSTINGASMMLRSFGSNAAGDGGTFHRMKIDWNQLTATYNSLGGGVNIDGVEAETAFNTQAGVVARNPNSQAGFQQFDILTDLQAWSNGTPNYGWVINPWVDGTDGWGIEPSETTLAASQPKLYISFTPPAAPAGTTLDFNSGAVTYSAGAGQNNTLAISSDGTTYTLADSQPITLTAAAITAGWTGSGTNIVTGPVAGVTSLSIDTNDGDDAVTLNSASNTLSIAGGGQAGDTFTLANTLNLAANVTISEFNSITRTGAASFNLGSATLSLQGTGIGSSGSPILSAAGKLILTGGANSVFVTEADGADLTAVVTNDGNLTVLNSAGTLRLVGQTSVNGDGMVVGGDAVITSNDALELALDAAIAMFDTSSTLTLNANADGIGSEGFLQGAQYQGTAANTQVTVSNITSRSTSANAVTINVNTAGGGTGNAVLANATVAGGGYNVQSNNGSILWNPAIDVPGRTAGSINFITSRLLSLKNSPTGNGSIGTLAAPIQTNSATEATSAADYLAGTGGIFIQEWNDADLTIGSAGAIAAGGDIQIYLSDANGHNLSINGPVYTPNGNIRLQADDTLNVNAVIGKPDALSGSVTSGTITIEANLDGVSDGHRLDMTNSPGVFTTNNTANAVTLSLSATSVSSNFSAIIISNVEVGNGGTITINAAAGTNPARAGSILNASMVNTLNAGATGTVILNGGGGGSGGSIGDNLNSIRTTAGTIIATTTQDGIYITETDGADLTVNTSVPGGSTISVPSVVVNNLSGLLRVTGPSANDSFTGSVFFLQSPGGIELAAQVGDANSGPIILDAMSGDVFASAPWNILNNTVTVTDGNVVQLGPTTTLGGGILVSATGFEVGSGESLLGFGTVSGPLSILAGGTVAPGLSPIGLITDDLTLTAGSTASFDLNGVTAGSLYDQINTDNFTLGGATLALTLGYMPTLGDSFTLINNMGTVSGTFAQGSSIILDTYFFTINYAGGDGNDVVLTYTKTVPVVDVVNVFPDPRNSSVASIQVNFTEAVNGFDISDLTLTRNSLPVSLTGVTVTTSNNINWTINNLTVPTNLDGSYVLTVTANGTIVSQDDNTPLAASGNEDWVKSASVNAAPVLDNTGNMSLGAINEDTISNSGSLVSAIISSAGGDRITDLDGDPEGIAVIGVSNSNGAWEYSLDNGATWASLAGVTANSARLLASDATTRVRFIPSPNYNGTVSTGLTFRAWDQSQGVNGDLFDASLSGFTTPFSVATETASITVTPTFDNPLINNSIFLQGFNGYTGTVDTVIQAANPTADNSAATTLSVSPTSGTQQTTLLRYENLFGNGPGQIPFGAKIIDAYLTLNSTAANLGGQLHRMVSSWSATDNWNTFGGNGIQNNNVEARTAFNSFAGSAAGGAGVNAGQANFGVRDDLQAWSNGETNNGWAFLPISPNPYTWSLDSSEAAIVGNRPQLVVTWITPGTQTLVLQQNVNGYTAGFDTQVSQNAPDADASNAQTILIDFTDGGNNAAHGIIKYGDLVGNAINQIPAGSTILGASLMLFSNSGNSRGDGGRFFRLNTDFGLNPTWNTTVEGIDPATETTGIYSDQAGQAALSPNEQSARNYYNVTNDVQAWVNGEANNGWGIVPWAGGSDGWIFNSMNATTADTRPELTIFYLPPSATAVAATLDVVDGVLAYSAGTGFANNVVINAASGVYTISDSGEPITLTAAAIANGWTLSDANTATGPSSSVNLLKVNTGDGVDSVTLQAIEDSLQIVGGGQLGDSLTILGNTTAAGGEVSINSFSTVTQTAGTLINVGNGFVDIRAGAIGTSTDPIRTQAGAITALAGEGGAYVTELDGASIRGLAIGTGDVSFTNLSGILAVDSALQTYQGNIFLSSDDGIVVNADIGNLSMLGTITINANTDNTGAEGYSQSPVATVSTDNTTNAAITITVGGAGDARLARMSTGGGVSPSVGRLTVNAGGSILLAEGIPTPDRLLTNSTTIRAAEFYLTSGANGSIGTVSSPLPLDAAISINPQTELVHGLYGTAGTGGLYVNAWGPNDFAVFNATATGGGVTVMTTNSTGHDLTIRGPVTTQGPGAIILQADDSVFIYSAIGGAGFAGTVQIDTNLDGVSTGHQLLMDPASSITTSNTTANAVLLTVSAEGNSQIVLNNVTTGDGGTVTVDPLARTSASRAGGITMQPGAVVNVGSGTVVLLADENNIGSPTQPVRTQAGTVVATNINGGIYLSEVDGASFTANTTSGNATHDIVITNDAGVLRIGGATGTDSGAPISLTSAGGVTLSANITDIDSGSLTIAAAAGVTVDGTVSIAKNVNLVDTDPLPLVDTRDVTITVGSGLTVNGLRGDALSLLGNASRLTIRENGLANGLLVLNSLAMSGESLIDLNDNDLVLNYDPLGTNPTGDITAFIDNYYSFGLIATGSGVPVIGSTTVDNSGGGRIIIAVDNANSQFGDVGNPFYDLTLGNSTFGTGFNQTIIRFTYPGDYNLDGQVDGADYTVVDSFLGSTTPGLSGGWTLGDGDFDGLVTPADYLPIDSNFGSGVGNPLAAGDVIALFSESDVESLVGADVLAGAVWHQAEESTTKSARGLAVADFFGEF
ncbi:MAG: DNRLRE domain-containing protein [Pirellulales bacterium]|nr:DNRLRE domain-containing protein [Pirellulales bacterium]